MFGVALSGGAVLLGVARRILQMRQCLGWVGPLLGESAYYGGLANLLYCGNDRIIKGSSSSSIDLIPRVALRIA